MHAPGTYLVARVGIFLVALLLPRPVLATWPTNPIVNVPLCTATGDQSYPTMVSDGVGGAIVAWMDNRRGTSWNQLYDIYVQKISADGAAQWAVDGVALCAAERNQLYPRIASDGAGGAIVAWWDYRNSSDGIYAQRISADGTLQWTADGVPLCTAYNYRNDPVIVADGAGGAIVAWHDLRSIYNDVIYAQRISGDGTAQWATDGVALATNVGTNAQYSRLAIAQDGASGAVVAWADDPSNASTDNIYAQHVSADGSVQWAGNRVTVCSRAGVQYSPSIAEDGEGGAIVTWRDSAGSGDIYAQRVSAAGETIWTADGVALCTVTGNQSLPVIVADGVGGAIVAWVDGRDTHPNIFAQRVSATGSIQWAVNGVLYVCEYSPSFASIASDDAGGAIVAWQSTNGSWRDIYSRRISPDSTPQWSAYGEAVSTAFADKQGTQVISDGTHGAIVAWYDNRSGNQDIYAQRIRANGQLGGSVTGVPEAAVLSLQVYPNPFNPLVRISLDTPVGGSVHLAIYDVAGRLLKILVEGELAAGRHEAVWDGRDAAGRAMASGSYFARLETGGKVETARMSLVR